MTLRHLEIFVEVCRLESITRAAEVLNMAQPAVSMAVGELESFYGVKMFERMNRRLYITETGKQLRLYAVSVLEQLQEAKVILKDIDSVSGIRFGMNVSYGMKTAPGLLSAFAGRYPRIPVYTVVNNSRQIEEYILNNELDFGIIDGPLSNKLLISELLAEDNLVAVCASHSSIPDRIYVGDLERIPVLTREYGSGLRNVVEQLAADYHIQANVRIESISTQCLIDMCLEGLGMLFLPQSLAEPYVRSKEMREIQIKEFSYTRRYYLAYHKSKFFTKSMKFFKEFLDEYLGIGPG